MRSVAVFLAVSLAAAALAAPPALRPSLAKINGLLDTARDLERKKDYAGAVPVYAQVLAECGEAPPRDFEHIAAKALEQTGNAQLALGRIPEAQAAYRDLVTRYGANGEGVTRDHVVRARVLLGRVAELAQMMSGTPAMASAPVVAPPETEHGPLLLLTQRPAGSAAGGGGGPGFEVRSFEGDQASLIRDAEGKASAPGRKVLTTGREMALIQKVILVGSCWDWVDAVFTRAGFGERKRVVPFKTPKRGPFIDVARLAPGDWMYFRNHSYNDIEHSGIFVGWVNGPSKVALVLSYPGMNRQEPGRYRPYELTSVYSITRPATL